MVREIDCDEIGTGDGIVLVDVREQHEWDAGHIEGAILLPLSALQQNPALFTPPQEGKTCVLYCQRGMRSQKAAAILQAAGLDGNCDLASLRGGFEAWANSR